MTCQISLPQLSTQPSLRPRHRLRKRGSPMASASASIPKLRDRRGARRDPQDFLRREGDVTHAISFLPGFPDGSFGWAKVRPQLPNATEMPKLFIDYIGMGDSDKPKDYVYSTAERTDLVEAIWRNLSVRSTTLVAFDFSSLVILEHLRRRLERSERDEPPGGPDIRGVFIFNGGGWALRSVVHHAVVAPLPYRARSRLGRPFALFKRMPGVKKTWSIGYQVTDAELRELHSAMDRHDGLFYLAAAPRSPGCLDCEV